MDTGSDTWWKEAVVYEIYPRSFNDSDGDGIGDIPGILQKVDYIDDLGVDVVWLCPVYDSPNADNGYDVRDYRAIHEDFGDMADFDALLDALHDRNIRLIMDLVVNHTSDEHEWFEKSRREEAGYEDYYHWVEGEPNEPPNNWESIFGGPAWEYDEVREAWYLHLFDPKQPDLNWRNPDVRDSFCEMVTWWLEKGIDGFRIDAANLLSKPDGYPDDPHTGTGQACFFDGPRIHEYLRELYDRTFANYDCMTVGEFSEITPEDAAAYCGEDGDGIDMPFQFLREDVDVQNAGTGEPPEWSLSQLKGAVREWQQEYDGWIATCIGNHDQTRAVSQFGDEDYRVESATLLATFLLTLRGTPHVYQGEELGMTNVTFDSLAEIDDPETRNRVTAAIEAGEAESFEDLREAVNVESRDHARTPMQWDESDNAGFTDGEPWLKVNRNYRDVNARAARASDEGIWQFYRRLIERRHEMDVLVYGEFELLLPEDEEIYACVRTLGDERVLVVLNWTDESNTVPLEDRLDGASLLLSNYGSRAESLRMEPYEARLYRVQ